MSVSKIGTTGVLAREPKVPACVLVILGITGDLAKTKLVPALFELSRRGALPRQLAVVGCSSSTPDDEDLRAALRDHLSRAGSRELDTAAWRRFAERIYSVAGRFDGPDFYRDLRTRLGQLHERLHTGGNTIFYLATLPSLFPDIVDRLSECDLIAPPGEGEPWSRVVIEKPFGRDLQSAEELNRHIAESLEESQVYRIDHFLGKETVQNIAVLRYANAIFEPLWNRSHVSQVEITVAEDVGIGRRGRFYDQTGVVRDMVQSHLLQVLSLVAMEPPLSLDADDQRDQKVQLLRSLRPIATESDVLRDVVFGQYESYRNEEGVATSSRTPTYVGLRVWIDNWRWQGVPFYLRTGKRLAEKRTDVVIRFDRIPHCPFHDPTACRLLEPDVLRLRLQPDEGIDLRIVSKVPGEDLEVGSVQMEMRYDQAFGRPLSDSYERLLLDCMRGDPSLFARRDEVEEAWRFVTPILELWDASADEPRIYPQGSAGPVAAPGLV